MKEQEIDREVLLAHLQRVLRADKAKITAEFGNEAAEVIQEGAVQIGFGMPVLQGQEFEAINIFEFIDGRRMNLCHR